MGDNFQIFWDRFPHRLEESSESEVRAVFDDLSSDTQQRVAQAAERYDRFIQYTGVRSIDPRLFITVWASFEDDRCLRWCQEFYPVPAWRVETGGEVRHSLKKWQGAANLKRYGLVDPPVPFNGETCALCHINPETCSTCVLSVVRGGVPCTVRREDEKHSPYDDWIMHRVSSSMVEWLKRAEEGGTSYGHEEAEESSDGSQCVQ
jgi:hypothetical protein